MQNFTIWVMPGRVITLRSKANTPEHTLLRVTFPNGRGASIARGPHTYGGPKGQWELAVLDAEGQIDYDTPIADDVIGYQTRWQIARLLDQIEALP